AFEVNRIKYTPEAGLIAFDAEISFPNQCVEITLYADLLDVEESRVISSFKHITNCNTNILNYGIQENIALNSDTKNIAVIVYANWKPTEHTTHSAAILYHLNNNVVFICNTTYPKKEEEFVHFNGNKIISPPNIPALMAESPRKENIQIALFRKPDDNRDLDYLCEFGKDSNGKPYLGVPTLFSISLSGNTVFCRDFPVTALCTISPLSPGEGGKYIMATGSSEDISESEVKIQVYDNYMTVEMVDPWKTPFPYGNFLVPYDFSYEVKIMLKTLTSDEKIPAFHTLYLSSIKGEGACLDTIPNISIRWGCLKENTSIAMFDGSYRLIQDIRIGDRVRGKDGFNRVNNVWSGVEEHSLTIELENSASVICTDSHPFMTKSGYKHAKNLAIGEEIFTENGSATISKITAVDERIFVYNLSLDEEGCFYANGMCVGDFDVQNSNLD
ncbi:MAG: Hint domain-containing protein, partial [Oscillospiraceae bacterium]